MGVTEISINQNYQTKIISGATAVMATNLVGEFTCRIGALVRRRFRAYPEKIQNIPVERLVGKWGISEGEPIVVAEIDGVETKIGLLVDSMGMCPIIGILFRNGVTRSIPEVEFDRLKTECYEHRAELVSDRKISDETGIDIPMVHSVKIGNFIFPTYGKLNELDQYLEQTVQPFSD